MTGRKSYKECFGEVLNKFKNNVEYSFLKVNRTVVLPDEEFLNFIRDYYNISEGLLQALMNEPHARFVYSISNRCNLDIKFGMIEVKSTSVEVPHLSVAAFSNNPHTMLFEKYINPRMNHSLELLDNFQDACSYLNDLLVNYSFKDLWRWSDIPKLVWNNVDRHKNPQLNTWCSKNKGGFTNTFPELEPIRNMLVYLTVNKPKENSAL